MNKECKHIDTQKRFIHGLWETWMCECGVLLDQTTFREIESGHSPTPLTPGELETRIKTRIDLAVQARLKLILETVKEIFK